MFIANAWPPCTKRIAFWLMDWNQGSSSTCSYHERLHIRITFVSLGGPLGERPITPPKKNHNTCKTEPTGLPTCRHRAYRLVLI